MADGAPHFCKFCGFDYWRSAVGVPAGRRRLTSAGALSEPGPNPRSVTTGFMVAGTIGLLLAIIAVGALIVPSLLPRPLVIENTLPEKGPDDFAIERFFWEARRPTAAFAFSAEGTIRRIDPAGDPVRFSATTTVDRDDWLTRSTATVEDTSDGAESTPEASAPEESVTALLGVIDGAYYERTGTEPIATRAARVEDGRGNPFAAISTVNDVEHLGQVTEDGETRDHLVVTKWLPALGPDFLGVGGGRIGERQSRLEIWTDEEGVPVRAIQTASATVVEGDARSRFAWELTLTFSAWGDVEPIQPPR